MLAVGLLACSDAPAAIEPADCTAADAVFGATANPAGRFANTLIRGRPPESAFTGNSWAALRDAFELGYRFVEVDVRVSADGHLIPGRHDGLAADTSCGGSIAASTVQDLEACTTTDREPTPVRPVEAGLDGGSFDGVYLDLKSTDTEPLTPIGDVVAAVAGLRARLPEPDVVVAMSYRVDVAEALVAAGVRTALKGYPDDTAGAAALIDDAAATGAEMFCVNLTTLDAATVRRALDAGVWALPWAGPEQVTQAAFAELVEGEAGGLISGVPARVDELLSAYCWR